MSAGAMPKHLDQISSGTSKDDLAPKFSTEQFVVHPVHRLELDGPCRVAAVIPKPGRHPPAGWFMLHLQALQAIQSVHTLYVYAPAFTPQQDVDAP